MQLIRQDLRRALARAVTTSPLADAGWLDSPPPRSRVLRRRVELGPDASFDAVADVLFGWDIHRAAGISVAASGQARVGATVVQGIRVGLLWFTAPCRVVDVVRDADEAGFTYATLPGHPETGAEAFRVRRADGGLVFEVHAVARHDFWGSRVLPWAARRVQDRVTGHYLDAARRV